MANTNNSLFSTKGFYLGVAIFTFGLCVMIGRVILELDSFKNDNTKNLMSKKENSNSLNDKLKVLQQELDKKIQSQELVIKSIPKDDFDNVIETKAIKIFKHNPIKNKNGNITAIEFLDFGCKECIKDAILVDSILNDNTNIKIVSKLNNIDTDKQLNIENLAAITASQQGHFFEFKTNFLNSDSNDLKSIINSLEKSNISLREFRNSLTKNSDILLNYLAKDLSQAEKLKLNSYTIFINNRMFSNAIDSEYNLKDIPLYINSLDN
jgi:hypothetical protein